MVVVGIRKVALRGTVAGKVKASDGVAGRIKSDEVGGKGREKCGTFGGGMAMAEEGDMVARTNRAGGGE